jgi:hypothetical protein
VHVLEAEDKRPFFRERLAHLSHCPEHLLALRLSAVARSAQPRGDELGVHGPTEELGDALLTAEFVDDLGQRPEGDPVAVRKAPSDEDGRLVGERVQELRGKACLADACGAEEGDETAAALVDGARIRVSQLCELVASADQPGCEPALERRATWIDSFEPPGAHAFRLPLCGERLELPERRCSERERARRVADDDFAVRGRFFQPLRDIHRVARDERRAAIACDDLTGVHADANRKS